MHEAASNFVRKALTQEPIKPGPVLEIGGRNINGTVRPFFADIGPYASIDLYPGDGVDLVGDVLDMDPRLTAKRLFNRRGVACVVCCEVLEHAKKPRSLCAWAHRILMPAGVLILTAANPLRFTHSGIDGGPLHPGEHYHGVSESELKTWLRPFTHKTITVEGADIYATARKGTR